MRDITYFVRVGGILCGAKGGSLLKIRGLISGWKKSEYAGLAQENGFGSVNCHTLQWPVKGASTLYACQKECIK